MTVYASSDDRIGRDGRRSSSWATALPLRARPTNARHSSGISAKRLAVVRDSAAAMREDSAKVEMSGRTDPRRYSLSRSK